MNSNMTSKEIRQRFLKFFENRGHAVIPSASLIPENDPSVLFNTAGMQPLVPYLLGREHPQGKRLVNIQKCVRTVDIDDIGDNTHATFFEMMGNWSLGDYFKKEAIEWSYKLLTDKEEGFGLDPKRLYITVFEGDENAPRDLESVEIWKSVGIPENRIYFLPAKNNWWSAGENGPCGPDSEMFYDVTEKGLGDLSHEEYLAADERRDVVEIWNDVFMEYEKKDGKVIGKLTSKNIDTGSGLERVTMVVQGKNNIYDTDLFLPIIEKIKSSSKNYKEKEARIIADHIRASIMLLSDGVLPSNTDSGYILRRLLRRSIRFSDQIKLELPLSELAKSYIEIYKDIYPNISNPKNFEEIKIEEERFRKTLSEGLKQLEKGIDPFTLFTTFGFPIELTTEIAKEKNIQIDIEDFNKKLKAHQELSRTGSEQKFKGGLADTSEMSVRYHTATHLLHQALRNILGNHVEQKGSNITPERLRFDFSHPQKMTDEEKKKVEDFVNEKIKQEIEVTNRIMPKDEAVKLGALHFFNEKYPDQVSVYFIGDSIEFCGGPHVGNTNELGKFKISKEEAVSQGVRRIKAVLE